MIRTGKVVYKDGQNIQVCFERPEMCAHCGACGEKHEALVTLTSNAEVGDFVDVEFSRHHLLRTSVCVYLVPLLFLFAGMGIGMWIFKSEKACAFLGLFMLLISLFPVRQYDRYLRNHPALTPKVVSVRSKDEN